VPYLFRTAVLIARKQPYIDWANNLDDDGAELPKELTDTRGIYLGRHSIHSQTLAQALDEIWEEIFAEELYAWSTDERQWPADRNREMFDAWFAAELCDSIVDLVPEDPLTEEDVEFEGLEVALNTCAFCGTELPLPAGRMVSFQLSRRDRFEQREGRVLTITIGRDRFVTGVVTPKDSEPARENADVIFRACSRRCEKQISKLVPRRLRELETSLTDDIASSS
jgi:ribosomal protein L24E